MNKKLMSGLVGIGSMVIIAAPFAVYAAGGFSQNSASSADSNISSVSTQVDSDASVISVVYSQIEMSSTITESETVSQDVSQIEFNVANSELDEIKKAKDDAISQINQVTSQSIEVIKNTTSQSDSSELTQEQKDAIEQWKAQKEKDEEETRQFILKQEQEAERIRQERLQQEKEHNAGAHQLAPSSSSVSSSSK